MAIGGAGLVLALGGALAATGAAGGAGGAGGTGHDSHHGHHKGVERVVLQGVDGKDIGWITLRQSHDLVTVRGWVRGLTPGFHGFHIHEVGVCDAKAPAGPFATAGGHYQGGHANHGDHAGDLPSLLVTDEGRASTQFVTDRFTLADLRDADGSAVMVHGGRDNFANIPPRYLSGGVPGPDMATLMTGDAGARAACGVID
ncbi:superoxide dismutase family protein [Nocardioides guangzhouensis]|uniref:Superoxide dismutase [Cu-Zn] n=1 Tax=Nocardioides guangzhouensis TaxID=2497878 RepID=A0A4Q4Z3J0_9ACTN|nr:superoxide dismutase family protein [Nocardioides guangzhouensis]